MKTVPLAYAFPTVSLTDDDLPRLTRFPPSSHVHYLPIYSFLLMIRVTSQLIATTSPRDSSNVCLNLRGRQSIVRCYI